MKESTRAKSKRILDAMLQGRKITPKDANAIARSTLLAERCWTTGSLNHKVMKILQKTILQNTEGKSMSSPGASPVSLFPMQAKEEGSQMTVISGLKCSELLTKSGPLGSLVKMLLESPLWWSPARLLTWEARPLCSKRITEFTDLELNTPSPSNESAEILSQRDIPSSRCLFRLALSEPHTDETESLLLPTPLAVEVNHTRRTEELKATGATSFHSRANGESRPNSIMDFLFFHDMLPTPTAGEGQKYTNTYNPNSQMGQSLSAMAGSGMLPTPRANKVEDVELTANLGMRNKHNLEEVVAKTLHECCQKNDGKGFRLSPLFTEEMMGFPLMWTTLPFLSQSGEGNL